LKATTDLARPAGGVMGYPIDEATIEPSQSAITDFLVDFTTHCGAEKIHVIAHSMGNRGLLRALQRIAANAQMRSKVKFGQLFLAAPTWTTTSSST
jgi:esterase/lipase superfamily enzyme